MAAISARPQCVNTINGNYLYHYDGNIFLLKHSMDLSGYSYFNTLLIDKSNYTT